MSPELADLTIYVIDVAAGEKIPRKGVAGTARFLAETDGPPPRP